MSSQIRIARAVVSMVLLPFLADGTAAAQDAIVPIFAGSYLGHGYNSATGALAGACVKSPDQVGWDSLTIGELAVETEFTASRYRSTLMQASRIAVAARWSGLFASVSGSAELAKSAASEDKVFYVLGTSKVRTKFKRLKAFEWSSLGDRARGEGRLRAVCGDYFIGGLYRGGELSVLANIRSTNTAYTEAGSLDLKAKYGSFSAMASASRSTASSSSDERVSLSVRMRGGRGSVTPTNVDTFVLHFADSVRLFDEVIGVALFPYDALGEAVAFDSRTTFMTFLSDLTDSSHVLRKQLEQVAKFPAGFHTPPKDEAKKGVQKLRSVEGSIATLAQACIADASACDMAKTNALFDDIPEIRLKAFAIAIAPATMNADCFNYYGYAPNFQRQIGTYQDWAVDTDSLWIYTDPVTMGRFFHRCAIKLPRPVSELRMRIGEVTQVALAGQTGCNFPNALPQTWMWFEDHSLGPNPVGSLFEPSFVRTAPTIQAIEPSGGCSWKGSNILLPVRLREPTVLLEWVVAADDVWANAGFRTALRNVQILSTDGEP